MGRGDKRTKRGKITIGSFGKVRSSRTSLGRRAKLRAAAAAKKD